MLVKPNKIGVWTSNHHLFPTSLPIPNWHRRQDSHRPETVQLLTHGGALPTVWRDPFFKTRSTSIRVSIIYIYIYNLCGLIKGSWEAILPSYEWLLLDGIDYDEGWCASETWWNWLWWRVVREWDLTLMKGGVSLCITWQYSRKELTLMKGGVRLYTT